LRPTPSAAMVSRSFSYAFTDPAGGRVPDVRADSGARVLDAAIPEQLDTLALPGPFWMTHSIAERSGGWLVDLCVLDCFCRAALRPTWLRLMQQER
jgi:hypothetical protein